LQHFWSQRRYKLFVYYFQSVVDKWCTNSQVINHQADKYLNLQIEYTKYLQLLLRTAEKARNFWVELTKRDPHESTLLQYLGQLSKWNSRIRKVYGSITKRYPASADVMDPITNDYFDMVLNVKEKEDSHVIALPESTIKPKKNKEQRVDPNTRLFSFDSETPMCLLSTEPHSFGRIMLTNIFFEQLIFEECGKVLSFPDLMLPEMREENNRQMEGLVS
jgi:hypothetical protein